MATSPGDALQTADLLDKEITSLREQVASLRKSLQIESSTILSSKLSNHILPSPATATTSSQATKNPQQQLADRVAKQRAYTQQCLHRISNSVTTFKVRDPDPNAVDDGHVLGVRFEVMSRGHFLQPYYVMLNRPWAQSPSHLRVHRHTLPPAIPVAGLAVRHLPAPKPAGGGDGGGNAPRSQRQDLDRFVRCVRREIVRYHNRLGATADLRRSLGLHEADDESEERDRNDVVEVGIADIEAKQISLAWADERSGRMVMDDDGRILKVMVYGKQGRDWQTTKTLYGKHERVEDVADKLKEYAAG